MGKVDPVFLPWGTCENCGAVMRRVDLSDEGVCGQCFDREWAAQWGGGSAGVRHHRPSPWGKKADATLCAVPACPSHAVRSVETRWRGAIQLCNACVAVPCSACRGVGRLPGLPGGYTCPDCKGSGVDKELTADVGRGAARRALAEALGRRGEGEPNRKEGGKR